MTQIADMPRRLARILLASAAQLLMLIGLDPALARETAPGAALTLAARLRIIGPWQRVGALPRRADGGLPAMREG
jgi:hypothetical protein